MRTHTLLFPLAILIIIGMYVLLQEPAPANLPDTQDAQPITQTATVSAITSQTQELAPVTAATSTATSTVVTAKATTTKKSIAKANKTTLKKASTEATHRPPAEPSEKGVVARIINPYQTPKLSPDTLNAVSRRALVNILCQPRGGGSLRPISGSGVIIDSRGVILTNAHVAQFVLLSEDPAIDLACTIRTGSPASPAWTAHVLYIPPAWVRAHVSEVNADHPKGTGEHDYALLYVTDAVSGATMPASFPALPYDTRHAVGFVDDTVLLAAYPAEFTGGITVQRDLYAASAFTTIKKLLTLSAKTVDVIALGGTITAQGGSSGGAVVNEWGRLIGLIVTTSAGATTADRNLNALTLYYVSQDLLAQTGSDLQTTLSGDLKQKLQDFNPTAQTLIDLYKKQLSH